MTLSHAAIGQGDGCMYFVLDSAEILKFNTESKLFSVLHVQTVDPGEPLDSN
jgi:hypothetical protein